jgi:Icc-related predicted phosphoesterase
MECTTRSRILRVVAISDTHGLHDQIEVPPGDFLVHAGDLTNTGTLAQIRAFDDWLGALPHRHKIVIAGNHDFAFEREPEAARELLCSCVYLQDEAVTLEGVRFYGSPWQPWFYDWAFNLPRGEALRERWERIPADTDVLITHGPPQGHGGVTRSGEDAGCEELIEAVERRVRPAYHVFGHIHEAYGVTTNGTTTFVNASVCTLAYVPSNAPVVFEVTRESAHRSRTGHGSF